jgi:hypothetical protein
MKTIELTEEQVGRLTTRLNIELRDTSLAKDCWNDLNGVFKQLVGHDHDNFDRMNDG